MNGVLGEGAIVNVPETWRYLVAHEITLMSSRLLDAEGEYVTAVKTRRL